MPLRINCPCGHQFPVRVERAGPQVACPYCGALHHLSDPSAPTEPAETPGAGLPQSFAPPPQFPRPPVFAPPMFAKSSPTAGPDDWRSSHEPTRFPVWAWVAIALVLVVPLGGLGVYMWRQAKLAEAEAEELTASLWDAKSGPDSKVWGDNVDAAPSNDGKLLVTWTSMEKVTVIRGSRARRGSRSRTPDFKRVEIFDVWSVWNLADGSRTRLWRPDFSPDEMAVSDDGTRVLAIGSGDSTATQIAVFDTSDGKVLHRTVLGNEVSEPRRPSVFLTPDNRYAFVGGTGGLIRIDLKTSLATRVKAEFQQCAACRTTGRVAAEVKDGVALFADIDAFAAGKRLALIPLPEDVSVGDLFFFDGTLAVEAMGPWLGGKHHLVLLPQARGAEAAVHATGVDEKGVGGLTLSPDARYATGMVNDHPWLFDLAAGRRIPLDMPDHLLWCATAVTSSGIVVGITGTDKPVQYIDAATGKLIDPPPLPVGRSSPPAPAKRASPVLTIAPIPG